MGRAGTPGRHLPGPGRRAWTQRGARAVSASPRSRSRTSSGRRPTTYATWRRACGPFTATAPPGATPVWPGPGVVLIDSERRDPGGNRGIPGPGHQQRGGIPGLAPGTENGPEPGGQKNPGLLPTPNCWCGRSRGTYRVQATPPPGLWRKPSGNCKSSRPLTVPTCPGN